MPELYPGRYRVEFEYWITHFNAVELQMNPFETAMVKTRKPQNHPDTVKEAERASQFYKIQNNRNAYVYGDTYLGMDIDEVLKILSREGFLFQGADVKNIHRFVDPKMGLVVTPRCNADGELIHLGVDVCMKVHTNKLTPNTFCGLGLIDPQVIGDVLYCKMDATYGLNTKIHILRGIFAGQHSRDEPRPDAPPNIGTEPGVDDWDFSDHSNIDDFLDPED